ncbi:N-acetylmuramic acid 6-phosphate etherase [Floccifex sp.]|uniref:N-acetylmuramic acid 6-phosphate etherase n=1 Tax=Floccifex sp. TaxID=2815810 RepID=UPI003F023138
MLNLNGFTTESRNENTMELDQMSSLEIVSAMNNEDKKVPEAIEKILPNIAQVVDKVTEAFENGGRLVYVGAGTSGRLGVLDASECPPTYGVDPGMVVGLIAGGDYALRNAVEGAEDNRELGKEDLEKINFSNKDVLVGIAASGRTPYVLGAMEYAKNQGAFVASISCNANSAMSQAADIALEVIVGPEVLTGSSRLKAGSAQKMVLNMITTASMVRIGKAYQNLMIDVMQSNEKLERRAENIVMESTGVDRQEARETLNKADNSCKVAVVMILTGSTSQEAKELLNEAKGHVAQALKIKK